MLVHTCSKSANEPSAFFPVEMSAGFRETRELAVNLLPVEFVLHAIH